MTAYSFSARDIFVVQKTFGTVDGIISEAMKKKMKGTGKAQVVDLSFKAIKRSRVGSSRVLKTSLLPFVEEANRTLGDLMNAMTDVLSNESALPSGYGTGGTIFGGVVNFRTGHWQPLSKSYLARIKSAKKSGKRYNDPKVFWSERDNWPDNKQKSLKTQLAEASVKNHKFEADLFSVMSKTGEPNTVSFSTDLFPAGRQVYFSKKKGLVVGGIHGQINLPTKLPGKLSALGNSNSLYNLLYGSLSAKEALKPDAITFQKSTPPTLDKLLLANEYRRPFLAKFFAEGQNVLFERLRKLALRTF